MKKDLYFALLIVCSLFVTGCATTYGAKITADKYNSIIKGSTTKNEVITLFGQPKQITTAEGGGQILVYESRTDKLHQPNPFKPAIIKRTTERLTVITNSQGIVSDYILDKLYTEEPYYAASKSGSSQPVSVPYHHRSY